MLAESGKFAAHFAHVAPWPILQAEVEREGETGAEFKSKWSPGIVVSEQLTRCYVQTHEVSMQQHSWSGIVDRPKVCSCE